MTLPEIGSLIADRFEVINCQYQVLSLALFEGMDHATKARVWITVTNQQTIKSRLHKFHKASDTCHKMQKILAIGTLDELGSSYVVAQAPSGGVALDRIVSHLGAQDKISIMIDLCAALTCLHDQGVVFAELTPDLILIDKQTFQVQTILLPPHFSFSAISFEHLLTIDDQDKDPHAAHFKWLSALQNRIMQTHLRQLAKTGEALHGWMYALLHPFMAPEVAFSEADEQVDIFSLGVLLYWLFTLELPFKALRLRSQKEKVLYPTMIFAELSLITALERTYLNKKLEMDEAQMLKIPLELQPLIKHSIERAHTNRYRTVQELAHDLSSISWKTLKILVKDHSFTPRPNTKVIIQRAEETKQSLHAETLTGHSNQEGVFEVSDLLSGAYTVKVIDDTADLNHPHTISTNLVNELHELEITFQKPSLAQRVKRWWEKWRER